MAVIYGRYFEIDTIDHQESVYCTINSETIQKIYIEQYGIFPRIEKCSMQNLILRTLITEIRKEFSIFSFIFGAEMQAKYFEYTKFSIYYGACALFEECLNIS